MCAGTWCSPWTHYRLCGLDAALWLDTVSGPGAALVPVTISGLGAVSGLLAIVVLELYPNGNTCLHNLRD